MENKIKNEVKIDTRNSKKGLYEYYQIEAKNRVVKNTKTIMEMAFSYVVSHYDSNPKFRTPNNGKLKNAETGGYFITLNPPTQVMEKFLQIIRVKGISKNKMGAFILEKAMSENVLELLDKQHD